MGYLLVDAVNQQCALEKSPLDLLILTKFAELLDDSRKPRKRIGLDRFMAITRLDRRTLQRHLHSLHDCGLLVCLDGNAVKGFKPKLYELNLPEGFDKKVIDARRTRYYGGKPFSPKFYEDNSSELLSEQSLPPVPTDEVSQEASDELSKIQDSVTRKQDTVTRKQDTVTRKRDTVTRKQDTVTPYNNITKEENNNTNNKEGEVGVVVGPEVELVWKQAAWATKSESKAFADLGITQENAGLALKAVRYFWEVHKSDKESELDNPVRYLHKIIKEALEKNGANIVTSRSDEALKRLDKAEFHTFEWMSFLVDGCKYSKLGVERREAAWAEVGRILFNPFPPIEEINQRWKAFKETFKKNYPILPADPDELQAAIVHTAETVR